MTMIKLKLIYLTYENTILILMHANFKSLESSSRDIQECYNLLE